MKKVEAIDHFEYAGKAIQPGFQIWVHQADLQKLAEEGKVRILDIPENRQKK